MLLSYAINIIERNKPISSSNMCDLDFNNDYLTLGKNCKHFDQLEGLAKVIEGLVSIHRRYQCPYCYIIYTEIYDFLPCDLTKNIRSEFHKETEKISVIYGVSFCHFKRNFKRFVEPLMLNDINKEIKSLFLKKILLGKLVKRIII